MLDESDTKLETLAIYDKLYSFLREMFYLKKYESQKKERMNAGPSAAVEERSSKAAGIRAHHQ